jgi:phosphoribosylglycinamide formyltransferase 1
MPNGVEHMTATRTPRVAVLLSGAGTTLKALLQAADNGHLQANIVLVCSDRPDANGLHITNQAGVAAVLVARSEFASKSKFEDALLAAVATARPDWIVLAGFMRVLSARVCRAWAGRAINLHPSLLPKYPGLDTHARAIAAGDTQAGASVHYVSAELDGGPVIAQVRVPINPGDSADKLAARVKQAEQTLLIDCLQALCAGSRN